MTKPPLPQWCEAAPGAAFTAAPDCSRRADRFARKIRIRNVIEYAAGVLVIAMFGSSSIAAAVKGEWLIALALVVGGTLVILRNLKRRAGNLEPLPEEPCLAHLRRQYVRQYEALRAVPTWYIGPLIPGCALLYIAIAVGVAEVAGWQAALSGIAQPVAITFGIFAAIALLNWWVAQRIRRDIERLDALAAPSTPA